MSIHRVVPPRAFYVYLQLPVELRDGACAGDQGWITVGRYQRPETGTGIFRYAPSYLEHHSLSIDPVNLPLIEGVISAHRYDGLHDVLRDICPDHWGKILLQRQAGRSGLDTMSDLDYLLASTNADRWGALAIGTTKQPPVSHLNAPSIDRLDALVEELQAMYLHRPSIHADLRRKIMRTPSMGGARPKATVVQKTQGTHRYWLVKPYIASDAVDVVGLEHFCQKWASAAGLHFAETQYIPDTASPGGALLSRRFDRQGDNRVMVLSAATLLQTSYPGAGIGAEAWSYPLLGHTLKQIGAPAGDQQELFGRMVFNTVVGNDDDHPRNHAVMWSGGGWRLAPAFDVVPNTDVEGSPQKLALRLNMADDPVSRPALLSDHAAFGFQTAQHAEDYLDLLLGRLQASFDRQKLPASVAGLMVRRFEDIRRLMR